MEEDERSAAPVMAANSSDGIDLRPCKICRGAVRSFDVVDMQKSCNGQPNPMSGEPVYYDRCGTCGFVYTTAFDTFASDEWTTRIYNDEYYSTIDPDYAEARPRLNAAQIGTMLHVRRGSTIGLDYGGGNGRTAELLRERGFAYDSYDPFGETRMTPGYEGAYNFCTAFEVAEHSPDPCEMMADIVRLASPGPLIVLIGTQAHDEKIDDPVRLNWWYAAPRNGHISLYSRRSLEMLGQAFGLSLVTFNASQHVFFRDHTPAAIRRMVLTGKVRHRLERLIARRV